MKLVRPTLLILLLTVFLAGCETAPKKLAPAPATSLGSDAATIYFIRPTGAPAAVKGNLSLDGYPLGKVFVRRYAVINVTPGQHEFHFSFPMWVAVPAQSAVINCEPGQKYYLCYSTQMGIGAIVPVAPHVIFSITPDMHLLSESDAKTAMAEFDQAFTHGEIQPDAAPPVTKTLAEPAPLAPHP